MESKIEIISAEETKTTAANDLLINNSQKTFSFELVKQSLDCIDKSSDIREQLLQYNLINRGEETNNLKIFTYRFHSGLFNPSLLSDHELLMKEFFSSSEIVHSQLGISGEIYPNLAVTYQPLELTVLKMDFFDRLFNSTIASEDGRIKGCYDETFEGVTVGDLLREMMINRESSENRLLLFTEAERKEFIFHLLQLFVTGGGALCQPETSLEKYLAITKTFYKELITVYKDSKTAEVKISGKAFNIETVSGFDSLYPSNIRKHNPIYSSFYFIVDPMKKNLTVIQNTFNNDFW